MEPQISIIIPIYNVAPYINRCLQSIGAQSYQRIECILIDDCSTDNSMQIAEQYISNYNGNIVFNIIHHQQNNGLSAARNTGLNASTCDYVYFIDSDDAISPNCIELLISLAHKYPNADYIQGNLITEAEDLNVGHIDLDVPEFCDNKRQLETIILCKTHRTAWNRLIKRSFLLNNSLLFPVGIVMEDHYWTYYVSKYANAVVFCHQGTYYYYKNNNGIVNSPSKVSLINRYFSYMTILEVIVNDLIKRNDIQACHRKYVGETIVFCMTNLSRLQSLKHWSKFWLLSLNLAIKLWKRITWRRLFLFFCMMPPLCFMTGITGWRWRLREYIIDKL